MGFGVDRRPYTANMNWAKGLKKISRPCCAPGGSLFRVNIRISQLSGWTLKATQDERRLDQILRAGPTTTLFMTEGSAQRSGSSYGGIWKACRGMNSRRASPTNSGSSGRMAMARTNCATLRFVSISSANCTVDLTGPEPGRASTFKQTGYSRKLWMVRMLIGALVGRPPQTRSSAIHARLRPEPCQRTQFDGRSCMIATGAMRRG